MSKEKQRIATDGQNTWEHNPFASLDVNGLPENVKKVDEKEIKQPDAVVRKKIRLNVRREKAGRGGKTVTVIFGIEVLSDSEAEQLSKVLKRSLSTGGTVKDGSIEIQGDRVNDVLALLKKEGYNAVQSGG